MSTNEDKSRSLEPDEEQLAQALKNKDDIPILMDVIADEVKTRVSQEDYLFNAIADPIPVLSDDVSELDVENALSIIDQNRKTADQNHKAVGQNNKIIDQNNIIETSQDALDDEIISVEGGEDKEKRLEADTEFSEEAVLEERVLAESGKNVAFDVEEQSSSKTEKPSSSSVENEVESKKSESDSSSENSSAEVSTASKTPNIATFDKEDLQAAIEKAFSAILPDLMEYVLKELSDSSKKTK